MVSRIMQLIVALIIAIISFMMFIGLFFIIPFEIPIDNDTTNEPINEHEILFQENQEKYNLTFNGSRAWSFLKQQVDIGFRFPGSLEIELTRKFIVSVLQKYDWKVEYHNFTRYGFLVSNILAFPINSDKESVTLFGAHYDTRWHASRDPVFANQTKPILGANDAASGVAILLEMAHTYQNSSNIALLFIDGEDQGGINGWDWIEGSTEFVNEISNIFPSGKNSIKSFILFDMIADWNLTIYKERNSNPILSDEIWTAASELGYADHFIPQLKYAMTDDHIPFKNAGIPAVDLIDFDYNDENGWNLHHTTRDTLDYVREDSLWIVGQTIEYWLMISN